ncbi:hypothetical protein [Gordonia paraffinivorans]|uniref:hypothetical protein n=1 Tax=Gordonia paraffinivorans TaxID=175628 RepID=UPI0014469F83|nr:hypothetical protein [Gordonia paraffinivorans]
MTMHDDEPAILASFGVDAGALPEPPSDVWEAALAAAFDPHATADPDTVPEMDDTLPDEDGLQLAADEPDDLSTVPGAGVESEAVDLGGIDDAGTDLSEDVGGAESGSVWLDDPGDDPGAGGHDL